MKVKAETHAKVDGTSPDLIKASSTVDSPVEAKSEWEFVSRISWKHNSRPDGLLQPQTMNLYFVGNVSFCIQPNRK
ncbi:hypothetical protein VNO77_02550 [Canavalia gladiata]|uniref:Uncharacterized protein n=1 Tax=Canavalia gladiata TaxID=3824 RepID=A0AAN9R353_CANGL